MPRIVIEGEIPEDPVELVLPDGELFTFAADCPAGLMLDLSKVVAAKGNVPEEFLKVLSTLGIGDTAERLAGRLRDPKRPISVPMLGKMIEALMEAYADRPTGPSGSSAPLPGATGSTSTVEPQTEDSTPEPSPGVGF